MAGFDTSKVIAAFQAGQQIKRQKEQDEKDEEFRKLQLEDLNLRQKALKFEQKAKQFGLLQGQKAEEVGGSVNPPMTPSPSPIGDIPSQPSEISRTLPAKELSLPGVQFGPEEGVDSPVTMQPQSMQELLRQRRADQMFGSQLKREENTVTIPGMGQVDRSIAPGLVTSAGAAQRQDDQQDFTAGENEKARTAAASLQTQRDTAAARRAQVAASSRLKAAQAAGLSGELNPKQVSTSLQLANSLKSHPAYADMLDIATGMDGVTVGLSAKTGLGDITAINAFQKMVDPGATVREGDVALIQTASAIAEKILSEYPVERLRTGAKLPDATRKQMMDVATQLFKARAKNYNDSAGKQYRQLAAAAGIPFQYIGQDFGETGGSGPQVGTIENGYVFLGGDPADPKSWKKQ